ncbi:MAG: GNAT family N-acetyltransferase [Spirochaetales bacterium]|nr:GNAT family N-acetyltransferase [Spirochaetales bacterium]
MSGRSCLHFPPTGLALRARFSALAREVRVRQAGPKDVTALYDLQRLYEIEEVCLDPGQFNDTACYAHLKDCLRKEVIYPAERNGRAGAKSGTNTCGYRVWQIGGVYTRPEARGRGIGTILIRAVIDHAARNDKATCLFVKKANPAAIALYKKLGYETVDSFRISYFKNGC